MMPATVAGGLAGPEVRPSVDDYPCAPCALIPWLLDNGPPKGPPTCDHYYGAAAQRLLTLLPRIIVS